MYKKQPRCKKAVAVVAINDDLLDSGSGGGCSPMGVHHKGSQGVTIGEKEKNTK